MKSRLLLLAVFAAMVFAPFTSCKDDEPVNKNDIIKPTPDPDPDPDPVEAQFAPLTAKADAWDQTKRGNLTYQLLVYSFADSDGDGMGDFNGITQHLDYISSLGAQAIWLSPIHPAGSYHGYDVIDYTDVNPDYGTMADFENLVSEAHKRGIKIYLDYVMNHTSDKHQWFQQAKGNAESEYRDYYIFSSSPQTDIAAGKIAMLRSEGSKAYNSGEWYSDDESDAMTGIYTFSLDWSDANAPTVTVTEGTAADEDNKDTSVSKYLYFGNGVCKRFYDLGDNKYQLTVDLNTTWGFLIRTSDTTWDGGTKYGSTSTSTKLSIGKPFTLNNSTAANIVFDSMETYYYHSHFQTGVFADLNYGAADKCTESGAYKAIVAAAKGWVDKGVDGLRLDAVKHIYHNATSDENPRFLNAFYTEMNEYYKKSHEGDFYMVGEVLDGSQTVAPYYAGLPALFEFDFWYRLQWGINNNTGRYFVNDIMSYQNLYAGYRSDYIEATKLSNHDEVRTASVLSKNVQKERLAAAVLLTSAGQPYVYYGEELGIYGTQAKGDEYVRSPMLWGDNATTAPFASIDANVAKTIKNVVEQSADTASLLTAYRTLALLRNTYPALATGSVLPHSVYNHKNEKFNQIGAWYRVADKQRMLVIHNFAASKVEIELTDAIDKAVGILGKAESKQVENKTTLRLDPYTSVIYLLK